MQQGAYDKESFYLRIILCKEGHVPTNWQS